MQVKFDSADHMHDAPENSWLTAKRSNKKFEPAIKAIDQALETKSWTDKETNLYTFLHAVSINTLLSGPVDLHLLHRLRRELLGEADLRLLQRPGA